MGVLRSLQETKNTLKRSRRAREKGGAGGEWGREACPTGKDARGLGLR